MVAGQEGVDRGRHEEGEERPDRHAGEDGDADGEAGARAGAGGEDERDHADHHRPGRHQDGPQPHRRRLLDRAPPRVAARLLQPVGEIDHQDAVLGDEADQRHKADLRIDVDAGEAEEAADVERQQRAEQRRRQGDENDERIAEALVLRRQHQIDDDQREHEHVDQRIALLLVLARIALKVIGVALGKNLLPISP